ncbi:hypothetical protein GGF32_001424 [Allomyces javanicus]|nr:hypothetical protein GGF32_001424 [Allomyces javanicus]
MAAKQKRRGWKKERRRETKRRQDLLRRHVETLLTSIIDMFRGFPRQPSAPQNIVWPIVNLIETKIDRARQHHARLQRMLDEDHADDHGRIAQAMDIARQWFCSTIKIVPLYKDVRRYVRVDRDLAEHGLLADAESMPPYMVDAVTERLVQQLRRWRIALQNATDNSTKVLLNSKWQSMCCAAGGAVWLGDTFLTNGEEVHIQLCQDAEPAVAASSPAANGLLRQDLSVIRPSNNADLIAQQVKSILDTIITMLRALPRQPTAPQHLLWPIIHLIQTQLDRAWLHHTHSQAMLDMGHHDADCIKQAMDVAEHWFCTIPALVPSYTDRRRFVRVDRDLAEHALLADADEIPPSMADAVVDRLVEYAPVDWADEVDGGNVHDDARVVLLPMAVKQLRRWRVALQNAKDILIKVLLNAEWQRATRDAGADAWLSESFLTNGEQAHIHLVSAQASG